MSNYVENDFLMDDEDDILSAMEGDSQKWEEFNIEPDPDKEQVIEGRLIPSGRKNSRGEKAPWVQHLGRTKMVVGGKSVTYHPEKNSLNPEGKSPTLDAYMYTKGKYEKDNPLNLEKVKNLFQQKAANYHLFQPFSDSTGETKVGRLYRFVEHRQQKKFWLQDKIEAAQKPKSKRAKKHNPYATNAFLLSLSPSKSDNGRDWNSCSFLTDADKVGFLVEKAIIEEMKQDFVLYEESLEDDPMMHLDMSQDWHRAAVGKYLQAETKRLDEAGAGLTPTETREDVLKYVEETVASILNDSFFNDTAEETDDDDSDADDFMNDETASTEETVAAGTEPNDDKKGDDLPF